MHENNNVVVASSHYQEDLSWVNSVKYPVKVYSKTIKDQNFIDFNKVQEVPAYLKYIIENYNNLPEYSIFVHGHFMAAHQSDNIVNLINNVKLDKPIIDLNNKSNYTLNRGVEQWDVKFSWLEENWKDLIGEVLPLPNSLSFPQCAQFAIHKSCILQYPIEFWQHLFDWCKKTELENYVSSRVFEYTWYYIFSRKANFFE
jgi:hypothetical protein